MEHIGFKDLYKKLILLERLIETKKNKIDISKNAVLKEKSSDTPPTIIGVNKNENIPVPVNKDIPKGFFEISLYSKGTKNAIPNPEKKTPSKKAQLLVKIDKICPKTERYIPKEKAFLIA